jgi:putative endonuclease
VGRHHLELGRRGESLVADHYRSRGYELLARNWRAGRHGELDLVLQHARTLVVCEVKTRSSAAFGLPAEAVDPRKQARIRGLTASYLAAHPMPLAGIRFDVASVLAGQVEIIEAAF